jgi:hypothetical protein
MAQAPWLSCGVEFLHDGLMMFEVSCFRQAHLQPWRGAMSHGANIADISGLRAL